MKQYTANDIINITLAGHSGAGKTSLAESMLFLSGYSSKMGNIEAGNTILDFDPEEIKRGSSISTSVAPIFWKNKKINLIDTPGFLDFEGSVKEGIRAADSVLITVSGKDGVCVGTEKANKFATENNLTKIFFVNGLCDESARFYRVFEDLKSNFGPSICPVVVPFIVDGKAECYVNILEYKAYSYSTGKITEVPMPDMGNRLNGLRTAIYEAVAETSDEMFEKYFSGESFTPEEIILGIKKGVREGTISPVFCGDAQNTFGIEHLLNGLVWLAPSAQESIDEIATDENGNIVEVKPNEFDPALAIVFKTVSDPFIGKLSYFKVVSGKITPDTQLINMSTEKVERINKVLSIVGKKQTDVQCILAGDIGAVAKLQNVNTGDTLCSPERKLTLEPVLYPNVSLSMAIYPKNKGDEDKVAQSVLKLIEEDPSIRFETNSETHQMIVSGLGEQHLDILVSKLKSKFGIDVILEPPKIPYRETIRKKIRVQGRHKKQTGGHGQFGDVWIEFEPCDNDNLVFEQKIVGGAVPKGYFPAVEKGLKDCTEKGPLAGYPVVGLKATLYDGSYHPVDSSEMAFKMAASLAYKAGMPKANPTLLEPISSLKAIVPDNSMGDLIGEITKRRGRVLGMIPAESGMQEVDAEVPMAEMSDFSTFMRKSTQGRGSFETSFERYEEAPINIANAVIESSKK